ncbi:MAG: DinB family protein, partial [Planctomycetota bacterium]|nr:DinB family protein [Planctomycetota bacterium]
IVAEFTGAPDRRRRDEEFSAAGGASTSELAAQLSAVYHRACDVVDALSVEELLAPRVIQGYAETGLSAVLHVLEHSSGHAGQIYAWTKQATGIDLNFYDI